MPTIKDTQRNNKIMELISSQRAKIAATRERYAQASEAEKESAAFKLGLNRADRLEDETNELEKEFMEGTVRLKPGRKSSEEISDELIKDEEADSDSSDERKRIYIKTLEDKLAKMQDNIEIKELELESLRLEFKLKQRDFSRRISQTNAKLGFKSSDL